MEDAEGTKYTWIIIIFHASCEAERLQKCRKYFIAIFAGASSGKHREDKEF
jgi:hypothetical protein